MTTTTTTTSGATAERERLSDIMSLPGAMALPHLAGQLAVQTNMAPERVGKALDAAMGKGRFAHFGTAQATAEFAAWQGRHRPRPDTLDTAAQTARVLKAARAAGVLPQVVR